MFRYETFEVQLWEDILSILSTNNFDSVKIHLKINLFNTANLQ